LEARAVPKTTVKGSLPERILYRRLTQLGIVFDFQSSLDGGRMELGGIVADFILPDYMFILNPVGPTHKDAYQHQKDIEQAQILEAMGYTVFFIEENVIYDEPAFEEWIRRVLTLSWGSGGGAVQWGEDENLNPVEMDMLYAQTLQISNTLTNFVGALL
jgi:very-short-patch-repair endonuclease